MEQFDVALRLVPFTVLVSLSVVQVIVYLFWDPANRIYLGLLEAAILPLAIAVLQQCWQWRSRPKPRELTGTFIRRAVLAAYAYGCLLASIPIMLFVGADPDGRLLIAASCAGLIATGMSAAVLPPVAIGFSGLIIAGSFFGLAATGERFYIYVATLLVFYAAFICFTILHLSRLLKMRVVSQIDLERQQEFTNLLLNEFEENASDWLWETNAELRLQHVSPRLVEVARSSERQLLGLPLEQLLLPAVAAPDGHPSTVLWNCIAERRTFRNLILPLNIAGEQRTWELSGKPIFTNGTRFSGYRGVGSDVTEKRQSEERLSYLALHDTLTDLPNRVQFQQLLEAAREQAGASGRFAVLALDLDEFKNVNDTFGHAAGDGLLRAFAERLQRFASSDVHIARLAGDEFALLAKGSAARDRHTVALLASDIVAAVASPFTVNGIRVSIGVSIGIAMAPQDGCLEIMRRADLALYRTKGEGRNGYRFYEAEMDERIEARRALSTDLRGALDRNEFLLHFQPIVSREGRVRGFEALVRWKHPKRGFVSPAEFIPLAEETGVIIPLGEWILQQACATAAGWPGDISIAVNLSPIQFRHSDLPLLVISALQESGLDASRLEIEITESVFLEATPAIKTALAKLRELGVRLSLDDFGTGYSSLSYLRRLAFDKIKIDQSFVRDLPHEQSGAAIVRAIIDLATSLKMTVIAEGVETEAQRRCLLSLGCHALQGYLFSRPVPADEANALVTGQGLRRQTIHAA
ncbi:putative bifunctional diguanylate cyclase/phosphodiesterase [Methylorubrum thiocyanatum]|uniref:Diguanylate cyclase (GGDEF)-like protein n=1 Tax=Methylorubrum thiocyanatum TaxID=47958 RepID=A0AA40S5L0_9HYPH|nr:EAL domain-containing protein [Methylorubrum thiocyanatum]MBA8914938.1 diguanylate cyclase (GGDEF)-like protein [Methylorubrum thiocyanatum]